MNTCNILFSHPRVCRAECRAEAARTPRPTPARPQHSSPTTPEGGKAVVSSIGLKLMSDEFVEYATFAFTILSSAELAAFVNDA